MFPFPSWRDAGADRLHQAFVIGFWAFVGTILFSVFGTLALKLIPALGPVFAPIYPTLVKAPTWIYMTLLALLPLLMYGRTNTWPVVWFLFIWGSLVGGMSELAGTTTGQPFGAYFYTQWFGPKFMDHVPYFIPPSWFAMALLSWDLSFRLANNRLQRILVTAMLMVLWDVSLDPAMSKAFPFWIYPDGGFFYGMPFSNWIGWFGVSLIIAWGFEAFTGGLKVLSPYAPTLWMLNCLFPITVSALYGLPDAALIGALVTAMPFLALYAHPNRNASSLPVHHG